MNISSLSIKHPVPAILLFILLSGLGLWGFNRLMIQDFPDMDLPTVKVSALLEGAAPAQLETEVARKIEDKLTSLTKLDHITTNITDGTVNITVTFQIDKDPDVAVSEVRNAVDGARAELPASMASPTVSKETAAGAALLTYTVASSRLDEQDLSWFIDNDVSKALLAVKGVASIARVGGIDREAHIDLNPALMAGLGVTPSDVSTKIKSVQKESSGGEIYIGGQKQASRTLGTVGTPADLGAISIPLSNGQFVRMDQIANIEDNHASRTSFAYRDGKSVIGFKVTRSRGFSDVGIADDVRQAVKRFNQAHPEVTLEEVSNTVTPVEENFHGSMHLLLEGALLAVVVVWWFLRDWRATFIAATALPLSILPAFVYMWMAGYSLNTITLLSLSLAVGILVDDAIVEIENIERHLLMGKSPFDAAMEAADEIGLAVIATTLTLVAVFLPTAFMGGIPGKFFRQFGVTASIAVLASLLVARLLTPMMAAYLLKPREQHDHGEAGDGPIMRRYLGWLRTTLTHHKTTLGVVTFAFLLSVTTIPFIGTGFLPAQDKAQSTVTLKLPPGSRLQDTAQASLQAGQLIATLPEVKSIFIAVGTSTTANGPTTSSMADVLSATLTVDLVDRSERKLKQSAVEAEMRKKLKELAGVRVSVGSGASGETLDITLASDDPQLLTTTAQKIETELRTLRGIGNVTSSAALQRPEVQLRPNYSRAAYLGVTSESLADAVRLATYGDYSNYLPKMNLPSRQIAIRARMDPSIRNDIDAIGQLRVAGRDGYVSLSSVADISVGSGPSQIDRLDRSRNITLSVELNGRSTGEVHREAMELPNLRSLPSGIRQVEQGELQRMTELFTSFGTAMAIGVFCIYAVLVLLFHDFLQPATILCALPLALGGALFSLWAFQQMFSMSVVIGILMLMGVVTKNSILLVEYAIVARRNPGMGRLEALMDACHKRARPIVMTTIAMGAGMLPNALGLGAEPSFRQPMAIVLIGGLITSTVLSLLVIPVVFTYVDDFFQWAKGLFRRSHGQTQSQRYLEERPAP